MVVVFQRCKTGSSGEFWLLMPLWRTKSAWWPRPGSNRRHLALQASALPAELPGHVQPLLRMLPYESPPTLPKRFGREKGIVRLDLGVDFSPGVRTMASLTPWGCSSAGVAEACRGDQGKERCAMAVDPSTT